MALDLPRTPAKAECIEHRVVIALEICDECVQLGPAGGVEPRIERVRVVLARHRRELRGQPAC